MARKKVHAKMYSYSIFVNFVLFVIIFLCSQVKAKLPIIFPPTAPTRIQWISGIGIPLEDLRFEAMTSGFVLKAEYFLPSTVEHLKIFKPMVIMRKLSSPAKFEELLTSNDKLFANTTETASFLRNTKHVLTSYRWSAYKGLEGLADRMGLPGRDCVLKSICEEAENPFHIFNGLFGELLHILLTPSSSTDMLSTHSDNEYFHAESIGRSGAKCHQVFKGCKRSLLDHFSDLPQLSRDLMSIIG